MLLQKLESSLKKTFDKTIERKCLWCGKEAGDSPRDICWQCMRDEENEDKRREKIVTVGMMENFFRARSAEFLGSLGGKSTSPLKVNASKENGKKGGRPKLSNPSVT